MAQLEIGVLLGVAYGLDGADKGAISAVAGSIEKAFSVGNVEIGLLIALVSFVGAVFALPCGALVDWVNRRRILLASIALWTLAMVVSGTATSYVYLLITRFFLGAVTAVASPAVASLVGDFVSPQARTRLYGVILSGELVGTGVGFLIAGEVSSFLDWRWALYLMAVPSAAAFWAIWRFLPEPARGGQNWIRFGQSELPSPDEPPHQRQERPVEAERKPPSASARPREMIRRAGVEPRQDLVLHDNPADWNLWAAVRYLLRIPTYRLLIIASSLGYYFFAGARAFGMIYLTHHYHLPRSTVTALAIIVGIGALAGIYAGAKLSDRLLRRGWISARIVVPGAALLLAAVLVAPAVWTANVILGVVLLTCGTAALAAANPPIDAARLDVVPSGLWGRGESGRMALRGTLEGGAPLLFGVMSDVFGGGANGLEWTFLIMLIPVIVASAFAIPASRTYPRDVASADASMRSLRRRK
jgi:predicted MFS family arabinose efflux permease